MNPNLRGPRAFFRGSFYDVLSVNYRDGSFNIESVQLNFSAHPTPIGEVSLIWPTGETDQNGTPIWSDDILSVGSPFGRKGNPAAGVEEEIFLVRVNFDSGGWMVHHWAIYNWSTLVRQAKNSEVVGNMLKNPELFEAQREAAYTKRYHPEKLI